jgi:hypothetical protein
MTGRRKAVTQVVAGVVATVASLGAPAAILDVVQVDIAQMSFSLTPSGAGGTFIVGTITPGPDTNVVAGAKNPLADFNLTLDVTLDQFSGPAVAYTKAALPATVDTSAGTISLDFGNLGTLFALDWAGGAFCASPRPDCNDVAQGPLGGTATGTWNPATREFLISWTRANEGHPFDEFTSNWSWRGTAQPIPEPQTALLVVAGLGLMAFAGVRRREC